MYDYGEAGNLARYGLPTPPEYDLSKIPDSLPMVTYFIRIRTIPYLFRLHQMMFSGGKDVLADPEDVKRLAAKLPQNVVWTEIPDYAHLDFGILLPPPQLIYLLTPFIC